MANGQRRVVANKTTKTIEFVGDASSVSKAAAKMQADLVAAAERIARLDFGKGFEKLGADAQKATTEAAAKVRELNDLKLAKKSLQLDVDLEAARNDLRKFSNDAEAEGGRLRKAFSGGGLGAGLKSEISSLTAGLGPAGQAIDGVVSSLGGVGTAGLAAGAGLAVGAVVVQKSVGAYLSLAKSTREFQAITRASTEDSSRFVNVLGDLNISAEAGAKALGAMSRNLDTKKWQELGIEIKKNTDGSTDMVGTFRNVLATLEKIPDAQQRANVLAATFGKSYQEILPLIERGAAGFDKLLKGNEGQVMTQRDLDRAEEFRAVMDEVEDVVQDIQIAIGRKVVPFMVRAVDLAGDLAGLFEKAAGFADKMTGGGFSDNFFGSAFTSVLPGAPFFLDLLAKATKDSSKAAADGSVDWAGFVDAVGDAGQAATRSAGDVQKAEKDLRDAFDKRVSAAFALSASTDRATKALDGLNVASQIADERTKVSADIAQEAGRRKEAVEKAQAGLAEQRIRNTKDIEAAEKAVASAQDKVTESAGRVDKANKDLAASMEDAQAAADRAVGADQAYRRVLQGVGSDADSAKNALLGLNEAKDGKTSAEVGVRSAERRLASAKNALGIAQDQNGIDLERASILIDLEEAAQLVAKAEKTKAEIMAKGTYSADELADAERGVTRAQIDQATRTAELNRRLSNLNDQTDELGQAQDELTQAELGLSSARRDLDKATTNVTESTRKLDGETKGYAADSAEAKKADTERAKAVDEVNTAHGKVVTAAGGVKKATDDQASAVAAVKEANKSLAEKITDAKKAEDDRKQTLADAEKALGGVGAKTKAAKDETVLYRDAVRDAIAAQVDQITKSNEASGKIQSDAQVMAQAIAAVRAEAEKLGDPKLAAAIGAVLSQVEGAIKIGAGIVGPISGNGSDAYRTGGGNQVAPASKGANGFIGAARSVVEIAVGTIGQGETGPNAINGPGRLLAGRSLAGEVNAWCQAYVNAVLRDASVQLPPGVTAGTRASLAAFQKAGAGISVAKAGAGDLVYKTRGDDGTKGHVGIVVSREGNKITTIEGNSTNNQVARRTRNASEWDLGAVDTERLKSSAANTKTTADTVRKALVQDYAALTAAQKSAATLLALKDQGLSANEAQGRLNDQLRLNGGDINKAVGALGLTQDKVGEFASEVGGKVSKFASDVSGDIDGLASGLIIASSLFSDAVDRFAAGGAGGAPEVVGPRVVGPDVFNLPKDIWDVVNRNTPGGDLVDYWKNLYKGDTAKYASGGYFMPKPGGYLGVIGEGRDPEVVAPQPMLERIVRENAGGSTITVENITVQASGDGRQFARDLYDELKALARSRGDVVGGAWKVAIG